MSLASLSIFFLKVALKSKAEEMQEHKGFHVLILTLLRSKSNPNYSHYS